MTKLLIASPIRRKPTILKEFLIGLDRLDLKGLEVEYYFVDDNDSAESSELLQDFAKKHKNTYLRSASELVGDNPDFGFHKNGLHAWNNALVDRIITIKDDMFRYAKTIKADYIFLVDSDILMDPNTIKHLISRQVDIVSEIFWTEWIPGQLYSPNAWLQDEISPFINPNRENFDEWQIKRFTASFYNMLKIPGIYEVGGLGACTLISKHAIDKGVSFKLIDNVSFWGEDRHFCIRARALGLKLHIDTVYPAYHIYRDDLLSGVQNFIKNGFNINKTVYNTKSSAPSVAKKIAGRLNRDFGQFFNNFTTNSKRIAHKTKHLASDVARLDFAKKRRVRKNPKITLSMVVHNESGRYLEEVFAAVKPFITDAVIIDDASTDDTIKICERELKGIKHKIIKNSSSAFSNEYKLRRQQWDETIKTDPDWILNLDADEVLEKAAAEIIPKLAANQDVDVYGFQLFDFWKEGYYRDDFLWDAHKRYAHFMIRYQPNFQYKFGNKKQHCGRFPINILESMTYCNYPLRLKHLGWMRDEDKKRKYDRYKALDPEGQYGSAAQYESILDKHPHLVKFKE